MPDIELATREEALYWILQLKQHHTLYCMGCHRSFASWEEHDFAECVQFVRYMMAMRGLREKLRGGD